MGRDAARVGPITSTSHGRPISNVPLCRRVGPLPPAGTFSMLSHLFMRVSDLDRRRAFYVDLLGLEVLVDEGGYLRLGGGDGFHIGMESGEVTVGDSIEIVIRVPDVAGAVERLRAAGWPVSDPEDQPWGSRHAWLAD